MKRTLLYLSMPVLALMVWALLQQERSLAIGSFFLAYHLIALALVLTPALPGVARLGTVLLVLGVLLFCGGLLGNTIVGRGWHSRLTPFGGMALIAGWSVVAVYFFRTSTRRGLLALGIALGIGLAAVGSHLAARWLPPAGALAFQITAYAWLVIALVLLSPRKSS